MIILRKERMIKYWYKIMKQPNSLLYKLMTMKDTRNQFSNKWLIKVNTLLQTLGFADAINSPERITLNVIIQRIHDQYFQQWLSEISNSTKLETYCVIKDKFEAEKYLTFVQNSNYRKALSRFRCSAHRLMVEEGRFRNINREDRICLKCNMNVVESEYHFLLVCPYYRNLRLQYLPKFYRSWPNLQKFKCLMKNTQRKVVFNLSKFIYLANKLREELAT